MDFREIEWDVMEWIDLEVSCEHNNESSDAVKFWRNS
jgi:hypothetical protein